MNKLDETRTFRRTDVEIQRKIDRGIWRPCTGTGHVYSTEKHANLTETAGRNGYLYIISNGAKNIQVSRIIWIAAHGIPDFGMEIDHINGNRQDNRLENLQLVTPRENRMRAHAVLTFDDAETIRRLYREGRTQKSLADEYAVSVSTISLIVAGKTYQSRPPHEHAAAKAAQQIAALDSETLAEICAEHAAGASYSQIAKRRRLAVTTVKHIIHNGVTP